MNALEELEDHIQNRLKGTVIGLRALIRAALIAVVARGHVLVEGPPGLGKTLFGRTLAATLAGRFSRVQGTADLMPADIIGAHVFNEATREFELHPGPVFTEVLLIDEINRASPKTQSALLQAMQERQVSIDRQTYDLPPSFLVIATQNPHEFEGTFPLPESQLDRFMLRIDVEYPTEENETSVLERYGSIRSQDSQDTSEQHAMVPIGPESIGAARACADAVHVSAEITAYIRALAHATREDTHVALGLSTRGALALLHAARVAAGLRGATFVTPDDVKSVAPWVVPHRLSLTVEAVLEAQDGRELTRSVLDRVAVPR